MPDSISHLTSLHKHELIGSIIILQNIKKEMTNRKTQSKNKYAHRYQSFEISFTAA